MNDRHLRYILGQTNHLYAKKELRTLSHAKKSIRKNIVIYPLRGYTQVLTIMPFYLFKAMEFKNYCLGDKGLTIICICDIIIFQKKKNYRKLYTNNENLLYSEFQPKITG